MVEVGVEARLEIMRDQAEEDSYYIVLVDKQNNRISIDVRHLLALATSEITGMLDKINSAANGEFMLRINLDQDGEDELKSIVCRYGSDKLKAHVLEALVG